MDGDFISSMLCTYYVVWTGVRVGSDDKINKYSPSLYKTGLLPTCDIISMYSTDNTYSMMIKKKKKKEQNLCLT